MTAKRITATCPDCEAFLEDWGTFLRCPWANGHRQRRIDDTVACGRPYNRRGQLDAPITGGRISGR